LTLTWGVAPGFYISRRRRWFADFCSKATPYRESGLPVSRLRLCFSRRSLLKN